LFATQSKDWSSVVSKEIRSVLQISEGSGRRGVEKGILRNQSWVSKPMRKTRQKEGKIEKER
jgi:hypothetical protein